MTSTTYLEIIDNSRRDLASVAEIGDTLKDKTFPDICNTTQEAVDAVYGFYGTVRLLIGGLSADPPAKTTKTIGEDAEGNIRGYIGTSIPGTRQVNLDPLFDRCRRLDRDREASGPAFSTGSTPSRRTHGANPARTELTTLPTPHTVLR